MVHIITTLVAGGAERQLELLTSRSRRTTVVVALYEAGQVADSMRAAGRDVEVLHARGVRKALIPFVLARQLRRWKPDVVHVHLLSGQLFGIPAARLAGVPVVVSTEHSLMESTIEGRPHTRQLRVLYRVLERMVTHTIAVSEATSVRLQRWGVAAGRITVADLGIDFDALAYDSTAGGAVRAELGIVPEAHVIGAVGRLAPVKRMDLVLKAAAPMLHDGAVLVVAGEGPLRPELQALADDLGVGGSVHWLGSREQIGPVLSAMDVMLSASADETFGMAIVEALGSGLPVVYVACPALEELPERPDQARQVHLSGDEDLDVVRLGDALTASTVSSAGVRHPVPVALQARFGAQAAADRVDAVYDKLLHQPHG